MIRPNFLTPADRLELLSCVKRQREDHGVARRANALLLLDEGMSCAQITKAYFWTTTRCAAGTSNIRLKTGMAYAYDGWKGGQSRMMQAQEADLSAWLEERFCRSTAQIRAYMSAKFNIRYSHSGCIKLLARLGFEYRKPKALPRVADVEKQAAFIAFYENLLNNLPADEAVYFSPSRDIAVQYPAGQWMPFIRNISVNPAMVGLAKGQIQPSKRHQGA